MQKNISSQKLCPIFFPFFVFCRYLSHLPNLHLPESKRSFAWNLFRWAGPNAHHLFHRMPQSDAAINSGCPTSTGVGRNSLIGEQRETKNVLTFHSTQCFNWNSYNGHIKTILDKGQLSLFTPHNTTILQPKENQVLFIAKKVTLENFLEFHVDVSPPASVDMVNDMYAAVLVFSGIKILGGLHSLQLIFHLRIRQATIFRGKKLVGQAGNLLHGNPRGFFQGHPQGNKA